MAEIIRQLLVLKSSQNEDNTPRQTGGAIAVRSTSHPKPGGLSAKLSALASGRSTVADGVQVESEDYRP